MKTPRRYAPMGGSFATVRVAGFRWNGWQTSLVYAHTYREPALGNTLLLQAIQSRQSIFLVGKRGIDFKLYNQTRETKVDDKGKLFTDSGELVRNYYRESDVNVHDLILEIASRLITNKPIDESFMSGHGKSWKAQKAEYIKSLPTSAASAAGDEMSAVVARSSCD